MYGRTVDDPFAPDAGDPAIPPTTASTCPKDSALRLCLDFDETGPAFARDGSGRAHHSEGSAIGGDLSLGQLFQRLIGAVDDVHVYARALAPHEVCEAAGRSSCSSSCN
jgi:hypothetical protein